VSWLQAAVMAPFVIVVPGYAIAAALFPPGTIERSERIVYCFVFGIGAAALGGLVLQVAVGLDFGAWLGLLLAITLAASFFARRRRDTLPIQVTRKPARRPPAGLVWALALALALGIAAASIAVASHGVREQQSKQVFASLWAVPAEGAPTGSATPLTVGVWNHGGPAAYRLRLSDPGGTLLELPLRLDHDQRWQRTLPQPVSADTDSLLITLLRHSQPYRELELNIGKES
jgi:Protein of unknown function (DUF1616)